MFRFLLASTGLVALAALAGCCGGPQCYDCAGCGADGRIPCGPVDALRTWRRSLTCGAGCGETYYDEWTSTPPDCVDPCPQFAGACDTCNDCGGMCGVPGGCGIRPVRAAARLVAALYGKRFCGECGYDVGDCCCGEASGYDSYGGGCGCASCGGGSEMMMEDAPIMGSGGCADGNCGGMASARPTNTPVQMARQQQRSRTHMVAQPNQMAGQTPAMAPDQPRPHYQQAQRIPPGTTAIRR
jgi:hypothetical protein